MSLAQLCRCLRLGAFSAFFHLYVPSVDDFCWRQSRAIALGIWPQVFGLERRPAGETSPQSTRAASSSSSQRRFFSLFALLNVIEEEEGEEEGTQDATREDPRAQPQ